MSVTPTPMMAQYLAVKQAHEDCLLLYRMGDFYELFFGDAEVASAALGIALTQRGQHDGEGIPMCGVPHHSVDQYLSKLIQLGHRVALCEQTEDPAEAKKRGGAKAVVNREVVRIITPGTLTEEALLRTGQPTYLASFALASGRGALAWIDLSTGAFHAQALPDPLALADLEALLAQVDPGEILAADSLGAHDQLGAYFQGMQAKWTPQPAARFSSAMGERRLMAQFDLAALDSLGDLSRAEMAAAGALLDYIDLTQKAAKPLIKPLRQIHGTQALIIDAATRRNLELSKTLDGKRAGSLLATIDCTLTGPGARLLGQRLASPSADLSEIERRQESLRYLHAAPSLHHDLRGYLRAVPDVARAIQRLALSRGGPRDLLALAAALEGATRIRQIVSAAHDRLPLSEELAKALADLGNFDGLAESLTTALKDEAPMLARDGGFVQHGFRADLDEQLGLRDASRQLIAEMQADLATQTGIASLKVKHNNVLGYFIEVTAANADKMPSDPSAGFIHRQTLASATRYTTVELSELEEKIRAAAERSLALELEIFANLRADVLDESDGLLRLADALALLDVCAGLATLAQESGWICPTMVAEPALNIRAGRHPVVEAALKRTAGSAFIANHISLSAEDQIWLLTGPNMAGKSTYLRQNALIVILAHMGSFVPAEAAEIGLVDRLFSRVGASDDLASGRSTFMVEMVETATILNQASARSFVILDEIGRGTATYDGVSIAWATVEYLHDQIGCRALFATHYHELTALSERLDTLSCHSMQVRDFEGEIVFLHEVAPGAADRSYGIHVGKLAGLPAPVVARAAQVLERLEQDDQGGLLGEDLPLFAAAQTAGAASGETSVAAPALTALKAAELDSLTPRAALALLYDLQAMTHE